MVIFYYETINHTIVAPTIPTKPTTSNKDLESQKPESFTWLKAVPPAAIAIVSVASCNCERPETLGMEAMIPAAIVIDTVADPTDTLTAAATRNATTS